MLERVEGDAAQHHRGWISETHGCPGVGALMHAEGEDENDNLKGDDEGVKTHDGSSLPEHGRRGRVILLATQTALVSN